MKLNFLLLSNENRVTNTLPKKKKNEKNLFLHTGETVLICKLLFLFFFFFLAVSCPKVVTQCMYYIYFVLTSIGNINSIQRTKLGFEIKVENLGNVLVVLAPRHDSRAVNHDKKSLQTPIYILISLLNI